MTWRPWRVVDAFTDEPFGGNPAALVLLEPDDEISDDVQQRIAAEANLSETAFIRPRGDGTFDMRWFTPTVEVELCGHATLAAGHVLLTEHGLNEATFHTRSGVLRASRDGSEVTIDLPTLPADGVEDPALAREVSEALRTPVADVRGTGHEPEILRNLLVIVDSPEQVRSLVPDMAAVAELPVGGVIVTAVSDEDGVDIVSRYFTPQHGIPEDPVTGSAHCTLGPWWCEQLGVSELRAHQVSARGGRLVVRPDGDRVFLTGSAVTVITGTITLRPPS